MSPTAAEVWCWVARMLRVEADAHAYAWPRSADDAQAADALYEEADAFFERAHQLDADPELWQRALVKWDGAAL